jgi:hypothetical protein
MPWFSSVFVECWDRNLKKSTTAPLQILTRLLLATIIPSYSTVLTHETEAVSLNIQQIYHHLTVNMLNGVTKDDR